MKITRKQLETELKCAILAHYGTDKQVLDVNKDDLFEIARKANGYING